ncbi:MAG: chemotaxis protein [Oceanidesulfovibrio sp.]
MNSNDILLETGSNELNLIEFFIDERDPLTGEVVRDFFGVNVAKVLEVIESPGLEPGKSAVDPCFLGTVPLRGQVLPVLDLGVWLGVERIRVEHEVILVTEFNGVVTGFLVSGVTMIHRVSWSEVKPPNHYIAALQTNCITGLVEFDDRFVLMLDLEKTLAEINPEGQNIFVGEGVERIGEGFSALVADDSTTLRLVIRQHLEAAGYAVTTANDGYEALKTITRLKSEGSPVDILVSDIEMPRMDGYSLTKNVKQNPDLDIPVILFSSLIREDQRHKGLSVGADDQITKPEFKTLASRAVALIRSYRNERTVEGAS